MEIDIDKTTELPKPWYWSTDDLSSQLKNEISSRHMLYGKKVVNIARRQDNDDALFLIDNSVLAIVHLTWNSPDPSGKWPQTSIYKSWDELYNTRILVDHANFE